MSIPYIPLYVADYEADTAHYVYAVSMKGHDALKIGVAANPAERLRTLQTGSPYRLECVGLWSFEARESAEEAERLAHHMCSGSRMIGEWFAAKSCSLSLADASARYLGGIAK